MSDPNNEINSQALTASLNTEPLKCFLVVVGTGCTCCRDDNFIEGVWRTREAAQARADYHLKYATLRSQFSDNGRANVLEIDYVLAGEWIILDERYAVKGPFQEDKDEDAWPEQLDQFGRDHRL